jgi:hypothetical protein
MAVGPRRIPLLFTLVVVACQATTPSLPQVAPSATSEPVESGAGSPAVDAGSPSSEPIGEHRIGIRTVDGRAEFFDRETGATFVPRGANYLQAGRNAEGAIVDRVFADYDGGQAEANLRAMKRLGYTAVRVALENCREDCIGDPAGWLRHQYLANLADFLRRAKGAGLPVLIQSNDLPEEGGYVPRVEATCCSPFDGYLNSQYFSPIGLGVYREYLKSALEGLRAAGAPLDSIFAYEIRGELFVTTNTPPLSLRAGSVTAADGATYDLSDAAARQRLVDDGIVFWVDEMAAAVRSVDPGALVAVGEFAPNAPNVWRGDDPRATPRIDTFLRTSVDFLDVHVYPGYIPIGGLLENAGVPVGGPPIPIVIGEYGAFTSAYADPASGAAGLMQWQADSCRFGIDGWFHWHWRGEHDAEVWTGTEGHDAINTVLSPSERPDPCATKAFPFLVENLAVGAKVRASAAIAGSGPELAVDGQRGPGWVSGSGPKQWIEIDLGKAATIDTLRLVVDQSPAGRTVHVITGGPSRDQLKRLHVFDGSTSYGDELVWTPPTPLTGVRFIRIETTVSPSWVAWLEIEALGRR